MSKTDEKQETQTPEPETTRVPVWYQTTGGDKPFWLDADTQGMIVDSLNQFLMAGETLEIEIFADGLMETQGYIRSLDTTRKDQVMAGVWFQEAPAGQAAQELAFPTLLLTLAPHKEDPTILNVKVASIVTGVTVAKVARPLMTPIEQWAH